jgi:hypothetical protein
VPLVSAGGLATGSVGTAGVARFTLAITTGKGLTAAAAPNRTHSATLMPWRAIVAHAFASSTSSGFDPDLAPEVSAFARTGAVQAANIKTRNRIRISHSNEYAKAKGFHK